MFLDLGLYRLGILKLRGTHYIYRKTTQCGEIIYKFVFEGHLKSALLKFRFSKKATNFETISHLIWCLLSKWQINCDIVSHFCCLFIISELYCHNMYTVNKDVEIQRHRGLAPHLSATHHVFLVSSFNFATLILLPLWHQIEFPAQNQLASHGVTWRIFGTLTPLL